MKRDTLQPANAERREPVLVLEPSELAIEQVGGEDVRSFDQPHQLQVTGVIDGNAIGGMTFYLALWGVKNSASGCKSVSFRDVDDSSRPAKVNAVPARTIP